MKKFIIILFIFCIPNFSFANQDYVEILDKLYVNTSLTKYDRKNITINFWVKILNGSEFYPEFTNKNTYYVMQNWEISCPNRTYSQPVMHVYDTNREVTKSYYNIAKDEKVVPDTLTDLFYSLYCSN